MCSLEVYFILADSLSKHFNYQWKHKFNGCKTSVKYSCNCTLKYFVSIVLGNRVIFFSAKKKTTTKQYCLQKQKNGHSQHVSWLARYKYCFCETNLMHCTCDFFFFQFDYAAEKFMQSIVIWQYCIISPYRILSVLGAKVSHINDLYSLPVLQKHTKVTEECNIF